MSTRIGKKRWAGAAFEEGTDSFQDEAECRAPLLSAGSHDGPDPLAPLSPILASSSLSYQAIDHHEANCLLRKVICGGDAGGSDELEVGFPVLSETVRYVPGLRDPGNILKRDSQDGFARALQFALEDFRGIRCAFMEYPEKAAEPAQRALTIGYRRRVGESREVFDISDQMPKAELHQDIGIHHVLPVGREVITTNDPLVFLPKYIKQNVRTARSRDLKDSECAGPEAPSPISLGILLVPCLVDIESTFHWQPFEKFLVDSIQRLGDFLHHLPQLPSRDRDPEDVTNVLSDRGEACVTATFEVGHHGCQTRTNQTRSLDLRREWSPVFGLALLAPVDKSSMLFNSQWLLLQFRLLDNARIVVDQLARTPPIGTVLERVLMNLIHLFRRKISAIVLLVAGLSAPPPLAAELAASLGFHDVARGRLRRVRR